MDNSAVEPEDLEVTVEVVPQTVNEIVYMTEDVITSTDCYVQQDDDEEEDEHDLSDTGAAELYEIGCVDATRLTHMSLVLDESQSFVLLPQDDELHNNEVSWQYFIEICLFVVLNLTSYELLLVLRSHICYSKTWIT